MLYVIPADGAGNRSMLGNMDIDVDAVLNLAGRRGVLRNGVLYGRREILTAFREVGLEAEQAESAFCLVRDGVRSPHPRGQIRVEAVGERRARRYRFSGLADASQDHAPANVPRTQVPMPFASGDLDVYFGDNLPILRSLPSSSYDLIYVDPPFNTGKDQKRTRIRTVEDGEGGDRTGFQGKRYRTLKVGTSSFPDAFDDFCEFLQPRLQEAWRLLRPAGSFFLHIDYREVHYSKVLLDQVFGRACFLNEIIWAYDYGARSKSRWPAKHDNILWYVKNPDSYTFHFDQMDRIPYMAPGLVGAEKAARGKTPTDVWWHTIVPTSGKERTGYPTQKPLGILDRIVKVHTSPGDRVLDFFAGSGTTAEAALRLGRSCTLIDDNPEAMRVIASRLSHAAPRFHGWEPKP